MAREELEKIKQPYSESQWLLGEERAKTPAADRGSAGEDPHIQAIEEAIATIRKQFDESQWYLSEERTAAPTVRGGPAGKTPHVQQMEEELGRLKAQFNESQWYLEEHKQESSSWIMTCREKFNIYKIRRGIGKNKTTIR